MSQAEEALNNFAIAVNREVNIRNKAFSCDPSKPEEFRWFRVGPVAPLELDCVKNASIRLISFA